MDSVKNILPNSKFKWNTGDDKLSEVIIDLAQPLLERCSNFDEQKKILIFSIHVWNICIVPKEEADKFKEILKKEICRGDEQLIKDMNEIMDYLIARKNFLFKNDKRLIASYTINKTKDGLNLNVAHIPIKA